MNNHGQSLIQALIGLALSSIAIFVFMTMIAGQQKESRALNEKLASLELENLLLLSLADGLVCHYELNNPTVLTFDSSTPNSIAAASIEINQLHSHPLPSAPLVVERGKSASPNLQSLVVERIRLTGFSGVGTSYTAFWEISFDPTKTTRSLKSIKIPVVLSADNSIPSATKITGCGGTGQMRIESGSNIVPDRCRLSTPSPYENAFFCPNGGPYKQITFSTPFLFPPVVIVTLAGAAADGGLLPCTGGAADQVGTKAEEITKTGFKAFAWMSPMSGACGPWEDHVGPVRLNWVAFGR